MVTCHACGIKLEEGGYRPAYAPLRADAGPLLCLPCDAAAWQRIRAAAALQPPSTPANNVWD